MRKTLTIGVAAITAAAGIMSAHGASARDYYYSRHGYHNHHGHNGDALAAGIVGLAVGAALASGSNGHRYYDNGYYGAPRYGYYEAPRYYYRAPPYRTYYRECRNVRTWDPYYGNVYTRQCW